MLSSLVICCELMPYASIFAIFHRSGRFRIANMTYDLFLALLGFAFVTSVTPGPNNMMLLASGVNFGFRRTLPHMLGISSGHALMVFLVGLGLAGVFQAWPPAPGEGGVKAQPMTFLQAAAFQWVNPKAWAMALGAVSAYVTEPSPLAYAAVAGAFACVNLPSVAVWAGAGQAVRRWLDGPGRLRAFNWGMAGLLVLSLWPVVTLEI